MMNRLTYPAFPSSRYFQRVGWVFACLFLGFGSVFFYLEAAVLQRLRRVQRLETHGQFAFGRIVELSEAASPEIIYEYGPSHLIRQAVPLEIYQTLQVGDLVIVWYLEENPGCVRAEERAVRLITIW